MSAVGFVRAASGPSGSGAWNVNLGGTPVGGSSLLVNFDNMKTALLKADWFDPEINPKLADFCRHYGMHVVPCRPVMPQHKELVSYCANSFRSATFDFGTTIERRSSMLGAIAGDIIGSRFEGHAGPPREFRLFHPACRFTDDSVCTLAVADALLGERDFAASLRAFVRRHPARGYGGMFLEWALADDAPAYGSWGNGAPMRVAAVGWLARDEAEALELAAAQAAVSHDHPDAIAASQAVALAILLARSGIPRTTLCRRLIDDFGYDLAPDHALAQGGFDISAAGTVPPAITAALVADDWEVAVRTAVCLGGDADTLACIAGAVAEAVHSLPPHIADSARSYLTDDLLMVLERFEAEVRA